MLIILFLSRDILLFLNKYRIFQYIVDLNKKKLYQEIIK